MISTLLFPAFPSLFSKGSQDFIAGQRWRIAIAVRLNLGLLTQRNQRLDQSLLQWISQGLKDLVFIVAASAAEHLHLVVNLRQQRRYLRRIIDAIFRQGLGDDLAGGFVDPQLQLAPSAAHRPTVLPYLPLAFPIDFQTRTIDH